MSYAYTCVNVGDKYSPDYVERLYNMIVRFDPAYDQPLYCYTDHPHVYDKNNNIVAVSTAGQDYDKWWYKLPWLVHPALNSFDYKILFDLDIVIHNSLNFIHSMNTDRLVVCNASWKSPSVLQDTQELNTLYNSSIMMWKDARYVFDAFQQNEDYYMIKYKGVDRFLQHERIPIDTFPDGSVYSYRRGADYKLDFAPFMFRPNYSVALFHQYPKQTDVKDHYIISQFWV